jgi:subtilase family serine protease
LQFLPVLLLLALSVGSGFAQSVDEQALAVEKSNFLSGSRNLGPEDASKVIRVTIWLKQRNQEAFSELVKQIYTPGSPQFHHFITRKEYNANFAPSEAAANTVREFLKAHNFTVTDTEKNNHYVTAEGRVADAQGAFNVQINRFKTKDGIHRAPTTEPLISGPAASVIASVKGLHDFGPVPTAIRPVEPGVGKSTAAQTVVAASPASFPLANCLNGSQTIHLAATTPPGPSATYTGLRYASDATDTCPGYTPAQLQKAYGLTGLYNKGWDGTGQTIVIVDAFGSPTIQADANTYSALYGLPPLTSANFNIYYPGGMPTTVDPSWAGETTLDVEMAHAIAPGANIVLVVGVDANSLDVAEFWAIEDPEFFTNYLNSDLGYVISNSWAGFEYLDVFFGGKAALDAEYLNTQLAAVLGISSDFASGDWGDNVAEIFNLYGITAPPSVVVPASSPYATAVGGTSLFLHSSNAIQLQTGWGNNETRLSYPTPNPPYDPPLQLGFIYGAGGGQSVAFARPSYQSALTAAGKGRLIPDISYVADPYTGVNIFISGGVEVIGGTSLATPVFSAIWAIANQAAGSKAPLGNAAPFLYSLPKGDITDILPVSSPNDVHGKIFNPPTPVLVETAADLAQPLDATTSFLSALYHGSSTRWYDLTFGTDTTLTVSPGWDDVTGLGTPNGLPFIQDVVAAAP